MDVVVQWTGKGSPGRVRSERLFDRMWVLDL